ncbi:flagellar assembly protein A [Pseudoduganella lutea]|nr:flagellar assembly protein A [Pseudoduganella lutea]
MAEPIVGRDDGIWLRADAPPSALAAAVDALFQAGAFLAGLDYAVFQRMLYGAGPALPAAWHGQPLVRVADAMVSFEPARRGLYRSPRIESGVASCFFEPVLLANAVGIPELSRLEFDEFVADMWCKGIRFGIDVPTVRAVMAAGGRARIVVARRLDPVDGRNATIVEVSPQLRRCNAPRALANGRFDLHAFENRFPQVKAQVRLLRKDPCTAGTRGIDLSGEPIEATAGTDLELTAVAGPGTVIEHLDGHDYLVSAAEGFVNIDRNGRLSIGPKIVGRDGASVRTTGNLQLAGDYEEFGDVEENVIVEGSGITIHGNVFGHIASRGGAVHLKRNLMGAASSMAPVRSAWAASRQTRCCRRQVAK